MEVEYIVACEAVKKAVRLYKFLINLEIVPHTAQSMILYCDNSKAVLNSKESRSHKYSKYTE